MEIPKKLYHAAPECALLPIESEGLKSNYGEIYAASSPTEALQFMWFRLLDHPHYEIVDGEPRVQLERHDRIYVWEIETARTDASCWDVGTDHSAAFFGSAASWVYGGKNIERHALTGATYFTREAIDDAMTASTSK